MSTVRADKAHVPLMGLSVGLRSGSWASRAYLELQGMAVQVLVLPGLPVRAIAQGLGRGGGGLQGQAVPGGLQHLQERGDAGAQGLRLLLPAHSSAEQCSLWLGRRLLTRARAQVPDQVPFAERPVAAPRHLWLVLHWHPSGPKRIVLLVTAAGGRGPIMCLTGSAVSLPCSRLLAQSHAQDMLQAVAFLCVPSTRPGRRGLQLPGHAIFQGLVRTRGFDTCAG